MMVRFKSEYQKSFGASGTRRVSPQHRHLLAGLRSDHMGTSEEPALQHRRRLGPRSCSPAAPPAVHRKQKVNAQTGPGPPAGSDAPAGPGPPSDPEPAGGPEGATEGPEPAAEGGSAEPRPSRPFSQSQPSRPVTAAGGGEVDPSLRWKVGLRSKGQRSGGHRSEYHRQFSWKTPAAPESPILSAHQVVHSCSSSVPPFKKNPVSQVTEYQRSFLGLAPPTGPRLRRHLEQQRAPLFHIQLRGLKKRREEARRRPRPQRDTPWKKGTGSLEEATPPPSPLQVHRGHRDPGGGGASERHAQQVKELRLQAQSYRHRSWGTNFSRDHLSQLLSEHNALWEPADSSATPTPCPAPPLPASPGQHPRTSTCVEALDLHSHSSPRSTVEESGGRRSTPAGPPAGRRSAWEGGAGAGGAGGGSNTEEEEGRLPTPRLKTKPVQRTHHDLTTPATGGAILVGKLRSVDDHQDSSCAQKSELGVSMAAGAEPLVHTPLKQREAWSEKCPASPSSSPSPKHKPAPSTPCKPIRRKPTPPPAEAPPPLHGIQGTLRHADFQHNGELGLRLREPPCSDGDDRLSVTSWRSAASCSAASAVLERALKRREDFWGKT